METAAAGRTIVLLVAFGGNRWRRSARLALVGAVAAGLLLVGTAHAGTYAVHTCKTPDGAKAAVPWVVDMRHTTGYSTGDACPGGHFSMDLGSAIEHTADDTIGAVFHAPADTEITGYSVWRSLQLSSSFNYAFYEVSKHGINTVKDGCLGYQGCRELGVRSTPLASKNLVQATDRTGVARIVFRLYCGVLEPGPPCPPATPAANFQMHRADVTLDDPFDPVFVLPPAGGLVDSSAPLSGEQPVWIWATDRGGGVQDVAFEVDGREAGRATLDDNGGLCRQPFSAAQPCKLEVKGTASFDTAQLPDGRHRLRLIVSDATGTNSTAWGPIEIRTANGTCKPAPRSDVLRVHAEFTGRRATRRMRVTRYGDRLRVQGRVTNPDGSAVAGARVCVAARNSVPHAPLRPARTVVTDTDGDFKVTLRRGPSRRVYFVVRVPDGAVTATVRVRVRAPVKVRAARRHLFNGQVLTLRGGVRGRPIPRRGVLVELQVRKASGWQTFATTRANRTGRFRFGYRFTRTTGRQRYRFRARVPVQAAYPYATGGSRPISVTVQGP